jgi:hypothetical protein
MSLVKVKKNVSTHSVVGDMMNPSRGYRDDLERKGIKPRNHALDNIKHIKQKQEEVKMDSIRKAEEMKTKGVLFKMSRFLKVEAKVLKDNKENKITINTNKTFLKKGNGHIANISPNLKEALHDKPTKVTLKAPLPREGGVLIHKDETKDFVANNAIEVIKMAPPSVNGDNVSVAPDFGRVPSYLLERKAEMALLAERKRATAQDPDCPLGMKKMDPEEVASTLATLRESRREYQDKLCRMPLTITTPSQVKRQAELEGKLKELDDAIAVYSRSKVYAPISTSN